MRHGPFIAIFLLSFIRISQAEAAAKAWRKPLASLLRCLVAPKAKSKSKPKAKAGAASPGRSSSSAAPMIVPTQARAKVTLAAKLKARAKVTRGSSSKARGRPSTSANAANSLKRSRSKTPAGPVQMDEEATSADAVVRRRHRQKCPPLDGHAVSAGMPQSPNAGPRTADNEFVTPSPRRRSRNPGQASAFVPLALIYQV